MLGTCRLNNKSMRNIRRDQTYQCLVIDLTMLGVISKENCEMLLGSGIPKNLMLPDGTFGAFTPDDATAVEETDGNTDTEEEDD